ncbi:hypothetical protein [Parafrankia sp. EUN1f]|uniref:hypothetical protein n=1 Tax=Parafrankia sp. EUN1f TaxID=102897 RepID=UPI0001C46000|nr:hypothetical protein [Parafrankia sp. EUN1f]EFC81218.1 hypothetical protein FrEUN1fDRAFT_5656 [Parafrankia sp. EUN1f]
MTAVHTFLQRSTGRAVLIAALAAGIAGGALSASHPGWFDGATSDAGIARIGIGNGGTLKTGPIIVRPAG